MTSLQFPSSSAVLWEEPLLKLLAAVVGKHGESCGRVASMWSQRWLCFASVHANMGDNPPHVFITRNVPRPVEKVVYRDARHADVLAVAR